MLGWIIIIVAVLTLIGRYAEGNNLFVRFCRPFGQIIGGGVAWFFGLFRSGKDKTLAGIIAGLVLVVFISTPFGKEILTGFSRGLWGLIAGDKGQRNKGNQMIEPFKVDIPVVAGESASRRDSNESESMKRLRERIRLIEERPKSQARKDSERFVGGVEQERILQLEWENTKLREVNDELWRAVKDLHK